MRQRKVKNVEQRIADHSQYLVEDPAAAKGKWQEIFKNTNPVYAEFGCGRGKFILEMAKQYPNRNYIAFEGKGSIILRALEKAMKEKPENVLFVFKFVSDVKEYFEKDELSGIYLNFNVPWRKRRHFERRLTHSSYLEGYRDILKDGCCIEFKTDSRELFSFSINEFRNNGMDLLESTDDLHSSDFEAKYMTTEYEDNFINMGMKINYCRACF